MFGLSSISDRNKKAKYKRFEYTPREYDKVKEDIALRRHEARERIQGKAFDPGFKKESKSRKRLFKPAQLFLLGVIASLMEMWFTYQDGGHFGDYSSTFSIGGLITFAYFFIRFNKRS